MKCVCMRDGGDHSTQERICTEILQQKRRDLIEDLKGQYALGWGIGLGKRILGRAILLSSLIKYKKRVLSCVGNQ